MSPNYTPDIKHIADTALVEKDTPLRFSFLPSILRRYMRNGGVELLSFELRPTTQTEDHSRLLFPIETVSTRACRTILQSAAIRAALRRWNAVIETTSVPEGWSHLPSYRLDGFLAQLLKRGGPNDRFPGTGKEAKRISAEFCESLFQERYEQVDAFVSGAAWSSWFKGIAWDTTVMIFDKKERVIWLLMVTDTD